MGELTDWTGLLVRAAALGAQGREGVRVALRWAEQHTGLPAVVIAAITLVASLRVFKRTLRFAVEVAVATALLLLATELGLLRW
ncbi:MAG TPA: hypothetical protein VE987_00910 [Polyangiaceae bacterium]|nr:hypothetical protein [Polyangiaceae bacterium]